MSAKEHKGKQPPTEANELDDPYLTQLEDLNLEDPTRVDVPVSAPAAGPKAASAPPAPAPHLPKGEKIDFAQLAPNIPVNLVAVIGKKHISVKDLLEMEMGEVIELDRAPHDVVDVVANGRLKMVT